MFASKPEPPSPAAQVASSPLPSLPAPGMRARREGQQLLADLASALTSRAAAAEEERAVPQLGSASDEEGGTGLAPVGTRALLAELGRVVGERCAREEWEVVRSERGREG